MWIEIAVRVVLAVVVAFAIAFSDKRNGYKWSRPLWKQLSCDGALMMLGLMSLLIMHKSGVAIGFGFLMFGGCVVFYMKKSLNVKIHGVRFLLILIQGFFIGTGFI